MLSALYYPFSRCIDDESLKQMLLLFESVSFLEPVADDDWRAHLMAEMVEHEDTRFAKYDEVHEPIKDLRSEGLVRIVDPKELASTANNLSTSSALSDLLDPEWAGVAANPASFNMPHRNFGQNGGASWQIFKPKLPEGFITALEEDDRFRSHLISRGGETSSWTVSYEAGSAISTALHLSAAEQFALAPITDSKMHHQLLLRKSMRCRYGDKSGAVPLSDSAVETLAHQTAVALVDEFIPRTQLGDVSFAEIAQFRSLTESYRADFINDLRSRLVVLKSDLDPDNLLHIQEETRHAIAKEATEFKNEMANAKSKIWPNLVASLNKGMATGGVAAVAFNMIGGAGYTLAGSILAGALTFLKGTLDVKVETDKARRSASPSATFLSRVESQLAKS